MGFQQPKEKKPLNPWLCNHDLWILGLIYAFEQKKKFKATLEIAKQWFCTIDHYSVYIKNNQNLKDFLFFCPLEKCYCPKQLLSCLVHYHVCMEIYMYILLLSMVSIIIFKNGVPTQWYISTILFPIWIDPFGIPYAPSVWSCFL